MEERLTEEDRLLIAETMNLYKISGLNMLKNYLIFIPLVALLLLYASNLTFREILPLLLGLPFIFLFIWFEVVGNFQYRLKKDLENGIKRTEETTIEKIKPGKSGSTIHLSNGLKLTNADFEAEEIDSRYIRERQNFMVVYTPRRKLILHLSPKA